MAKQVETTPKNRVYFEKPQLIEVGEDEVRVRTPSPVVDIADGFHDTVRTLSCNYDGVKSVPPHYPKQGVDYGCSKFPTVKEACEYLDRNEIHGYGKGAIVARRWAMPWRFMYHHQWGMIWCNHYTPRTNQTWFPYTVRWLEVGQEEGAWAEDLVVIHACLDDELLCSVVEEQGVDTSEAHEMIEQRRKGAV